MSGQIRENKDYFRTKNTIEKQNKKKAAFSNKENCMCSGGNVEKRQNGIEYYERRHNWLIYSLSKSTLKYNISLQTLL